MHSKISFICFQLARRNTEEIERETKAPELSLLNTDYRASSQNVGLVHSILSMSFERERMRKTAENQYFFIKIVGRRRSLYLSHSCDDIGED
jgi:hypothetical protein